MEDQVAASRQKSAQTKETYETTTLDEVRLRLFRSRAMAHAWVNTIAAGQREGSAALFAQVALKSLAKWTTPTVLLSQHLVDAPSLDHSALALCVSIAEDASKLPLLEALHIVTGLYPSLMSATRRSALGAFYTPPCLVGRLLDLAAESGIDWSKARVLDPASGAGAFLVAAAFRIKHAMGSCEPAFLLSQFAARLRGIELDPVAAGLAQGALEIAFADTALAAKRPVPLIIDVADSLETKSQPIFDLVVGNPPYGRVSLTPAQRKRYARSLYGHANLYGVFTDVALRWTKPGGRIAYLTPTSFLAGQYYSALRALLVQEAPPVAMDFVHARRGVFEDVLQETMLAVYARGRPVQRVQIHYVRVQNDRDAELIRNGTVAIPKMASAPWLAPRDQRHAALIAHVECMSTRLANWGYEVSTGPLVWNRFKSQMKSNADGANRHPIVWAEAITADGRFIWRAEKRNHAPFLKLTKKDGWLKIDRPCVLVQRTTAKEQSRRLIAAELTSRFIKKHKGVVVENHLNMVRATDKPALPPSVVAALINSNALDQVFRCMNGSVAVSAFELEALPLPRITQLKRLIELVAKKADRSKIDYECDRLYGLRK